MTLQINDHCHLGTANPPVTEYDVQMGTLDFTANTAVTFERGITGQLHTHRLLTGSDPVQFDEDKEVLICTLAEMLVVKALAGQRVYYVPNYHDDDAIGTWSTSSYIIRGLLIIAQGAITNLDPCGVYWTVQLQIVDDDKVT